MNLLKVSGVFFVCVLICACSSTNPPEPVDATGRWELINTDMSNLKKEF